MWILSTFLILSFVLLKTWLYICLYVLLRSTMWEDLFELFSFSCLFVTISVMLLGQAIVTFTESGGLLSRGWSSWSGWKSSRVWLVDLIFFYVLFICCYLEKNHFTSKRKIMLSTGSSFILMFGIVRWTISQLMLEISFSEKNNL